MPGLDTGERCGPTRTSPAITAAAAWLRDSNIPRSTSMRVESAFTRHVAKGTDEATVITFT